MYIVGLPQQCDGTRASPSRKPNAAPAAAPAGSNARRMPSLSDSSTATRPATPRAADLPFELMRSDSVTWAACAAACLQHHALATLAAPADSAPADSAHAGSEGALALLAHSVAAALPVQQQCQDSKQLGRKRGREELVVLQPDKRQALQPAAAPPAAVSLM